MDREGLNLLEMPKMKLSYTYWDVSQKNTFSESLQIYTGIVREAPNSGAPFQYS